jgi:hypothetical protein
MRIDRYFRVGAGALAAGLMLGPVAMAAAPGTDVCTPSTPCTCTSSSFTVQLVDKTVTPGTASSQTTAKYTYKVSGSASKIGGIQNGQFVIPRPVVNATSATNGDILVQASGTGSGVFNVLNYCDSDRNTGINKGNCDGFLAYVAPSPTSPASSTAVNMVVVSGQRVADGLLTVNIVSGNGSSELCQALDANNVPTGIVGPGDIGDPFQPKFVKQDAAVAGGKCVAHLTFDKHGNVANVTTDEPCASGSPGHLDSHGVMSNFPTEQITIKVNGVDQPLQNNNGPHGNTWGTGTTTCYGPSIPSPAKCVCTVSPCP